MHRAQSTNRTVSIDFSDLWNSHLDPSCIWWNSNQIVSISSFCLPLYLTLVLSLSLSLQNGSHAGRARSNDFTRNRSLLKWFLQNWQLFIWLQWMQASHWLHHLIWPLVMLADLLSANGAFDAAAKALGEGHLWGRNLQMQHCLQIW